jgi:hypothetical protein
MAKNRLEGASPFKRFFFNPFPKKLHVHSINKCKNSLAEGDR